MACQCKIERCCSAIPDTAVRRGRTSSKMLLVLLLLAGLAAITGGDDATPTWQQRPPSNSVHIPKAGGYSLFATLEQHAASLGGGHGHVCNHHGDAWERRWLEAPDRRSCWLHASEAPYPTKLFNESPRSRVRCSSTRCSPTTQHHNVK